MPGAVIARVIRAPARSLARAEEPAQRDRREVARDRRALGAFERAAAARAARPRPVRPPARCARPARAAACSRAPNCQFVEHERAQQRERPARCESQFSSTALPRISSAPGWIFGSLSLQSAGTGKPSPSRSRFGASRPSQSSSMPLPKMSARARVDVRVRVVAVHAEAEAVAVAVDAALALGDDVDEVVARLVVAGAAGDPLRDAVAGVDGVVAGLAEVLVDAAAAREGVVAGAAGEHVVRRAAGEGVVAVAARDLHREGDVVRRQRVVAPGEVDRDARDARGLLACDRSGASARACTVRQRQARHPCG